MSSINPDLLQDKAELRYAGTEEPLISVIIPTYNRLDFLREAIASVMAQSYIHWELIIVDDGSTDGTVEAIQNIGDPRIQVLVLPHTGHISNVMNAGAKMSQGEWLAFLDSDDLWLPQKLELQIETLKKENRKWIYGGYEFIDEDKNIIYRSSEKFAPLSGLIIKEVIMAKTGITICSVVVEKKLFEEIGGFSPDPDVRGDYEFLLRLAMKTEASFTPYIVTRVRDHSSRTYRSRVYPHERTALTYKAFINQKPGKELEKLARKRLAFLLAEASVHRFSKGENWVALRQLRQSLWMKDRPRHWLSAFKRGIYAAFKKYSQHSAKERKTGNVAAYNS